jgi:2-dehydro-3-deoxyphosphogluconate aldolase / (4S)-4-hydroxy-2-oxoglutarate aldolase
MTARLPISDVLLASRVVAIVRGRSAEHVLAVCDTLIQDGVRCLEITTNTPGWAEGIRTLRARYGSEVDLGSGTVLTADHVAQTVDAGGAFLVSPSLDLSVGEAAAEAGLAWYPGTLTPTEMVTAWNAGATAVKVFPAATAGGPEYLKQVRAPLDDVLMIPTGGVSATDIPGYLRAGASAVGVGSPLIGDALATGDLDGLRARATAILAAAAPEGGA